MFELTEIGIVLRRADKKITAFFSRCYAKLFITTNVCNWAT